MVWLFFLGLGVLAFVWGRLERLNQGLGQGLHLRGLGRKGTTKLVVIGQGLTSILLFAMMVGAFFLFGWKIGIGAVIAGFGLGVLFS